MPPLSLGVSSCIIDVLDNKTGNALYCEGLVFGKYMYFGTRDFVKTN